MIPTKKDLEKLELEATLYHELNKYVYLREDEKGRYVEYAFIPGAPHDNRCLSWYNKPHPKTLMGEPYNYTKELIEKHDKKLTPVGELYELCEFSCGFENKEGDEKCCAGSPRKSCLYAGRKWDYNEPIKCACWYLSDPHIPRQVSIPIEKALEIKNILLK